MRREVQLGGDPSFQRQGVQGCKEADGSSGGPERAWFGLENEASGGGADQPAELPREAGERHVAAEQPRFRKVHDERRIDGAVQAFAQGEHGDRDTEDDGGLSSGEPGPADQHRNERAGPDHTHQREPAHPALAFDELHDRQLPERDAACEDEPEHPDRRFAHVRAVLREGREELAHDGDPGADEDDVEDDVAEKDAVAQDVGVAAGLVVRVDVTRRGNDPQHGDEDEERGGVEQEQKRERARVRRAGDGAGDEAAERDTEVHGHSLLRESGVTPFLGCERAEERGLTRPEGAAAETDERVQRERLPGVANQREERERDGHHDQRTGQDSTRPQPVRERTADEDGEEPGGGIGRDDEPRDTERDPAHVVEVDDQKRPDHPVPEHVREPAGLKNPNVSRQLRIQTSEVAAHAEEANAANAGFAGVRRKRSPVGDEPNEVIMATRSGAGLRSGVRLAGIEPATLRSGGARSIP